MFVVLFYGQVGQALSTDSLLQRKVFGVEVRGDGGEGIELVLGRADLGFSVARAMSHGYHDAELCVDLDR
ncbi:hypothetical protein ACJ6WF_06385 [Streptomyces sp. MMS24-I2-30]|uniref:hypothetical protein n=1 Tax=Streptomyces sp. MMS24-I2-30 TaxID=3351564 RepID=UPI003896A35C